MNTMNCTLPLNWTFERFTPWLISSTAPTNASVSAIVTMVANVNVRLRLRLVAISLTT